MKLNAQSQSGSISVEGQVYRIAGGGVVVTNPQHARQLINSHGFTEWKEGQPAHVDETSELDEDANDAEIMLKSLPNLPRPFMQKMLKELGVVYPQSAKNDDLRAMLREQIEARIAREKQPGQTPQPIAHTDEAAKIAAAANARKLEDEQRDRNGGKTDAELNDETAKSLEAAGMVDTDIAAAREAGTHGFIKAE